MPTPVATDSTSLASVLARHLASREVEAGDGAPATITDALFEIARQQKRTADAIHRLADVIEMRPAESL